MPESRLWLLNCNGNVFTISTTQQFLEQLPKSSDCTVCLKRVSVCQHCAWGVGHNHRVYVYVIGSEVPIRVKDATYENQRWGPGGFSGRKLLRTDRQSWSDEHGFGYQPKDSFELPSSHWQWESDWMVDSNVRDEMSVDRMGWLYAGNFTGAWTTESHWNSFVRKRRWIRFRRYISTNTWAMIDDNEGLCEKECFIDIAIGGSELPSQPPGHICVWAVTHIGKVYYRQGVWQNCPEGTTWVNVPVETKGVVNIAVGPTGLVWAVTWDGQTLVRTGISRDEPYGTAWVVVCYPREDTRLSQVALGLNALWALSRDGKVWYRKGIKGRDFESAAGEIWVEMVGEMAFISVSPNDQVFAIGQNNGHVYFRTGVTANDLGGKTWQHIKLGEDHALHHEDSQGSEMSSHPSSPPSDDNLSWSGSLGFSSPTTPQSPSFPALEAPFSPDDVFIMDSHSLQCSLGASGVENRETSEEEKYVENKSFEREEARRERTSLMDDSSDRKTTLMSSSIGQDGEKLDSRVVFSLEPDCAGADLDAQGTVSAGEAEKESSASEQPICDIKPQGKTVSPAASSTALSAYMSSCEQRKSPSRFCDDDDFEDVPDTIIDFVTDLPDEDEDEDGAPENASRVGVEGEEMSGVSAAERTEEESHRSSVRDKSGSGSRSSVPMMSMMTKPASGRISETSEVSSQGPAEMMALMPAMPRLIFVWLSASACTFDCPQSVSWLQTTKESGSSLRNKRPAVSFQLRRRILQLLQARNRKEAEASRDISVIPQALDQTAWVKKTGMQWFQDDWSHWCECHVELDTGQPGASNGHLTIYYTHRHKQLHRQIALSDVTCVKRLQDPLYRSVLAVHLMESDLTYKPIYLRTASEAEAEEWTALLYRSALSLQQSVPVGSLWSTTLRGDVFVHCPATASQKPYQMQWLPVGGHLQVVVTSPCGVTWAVSWDNTPWVYSGGYGGGVFPETSNMSKDVSPMSDAQVISVFEMQQWYPVVGFCNKGFLMEGAEWGDVSGRREQTKEEVKLPSRLWHWAGEWGVDFAAPGGVNGDGWQYASNVNRPFHRGKGLRDDVRRRKWCRKSKMATVGPWIACPKLQLRDVSIQLDLPSQRSEVVVVWAVVLSGDVVCRLGVTMENPMGYEWDFVETTLPFHSVSVGGGYRVWALAKNGSAWYRPGVSPTNPKGSRWLQVVPPPTGNSLLQQISVGGSAVWAVDNQGTLWYRQEITPTFPEGTRWTYVCNRVLSVSVGPANQVWIMAESNFGRNRHREGVIYRRLGISDTTPTGTSWEPVIGCGWKSVSIRGLRESQDTIQDD